MIYNYYSINICTYKNFIEMDDNFYKIFNIQDYSISGSFYQSFYTIKKIEFINCEIIGEYAFYGCSELIDISMPQCKNVYSWAFGNCAKLEKIILPKCESIRGDAFTYDYKLKEVILPKCQILGDGAFWSCSKLNYISIPECRSITKDVFTGCVSLSQITLPNIEFFTFDYTFSSCPLFTKMFLPGSQVAFASIIYEDKMYYDWMNQVTIYVPASLISNYRIASNWSLFSDHFQPLN